MVLPLLQTRAVEVAPSEVRCSFTTLQTLPCARGASMSAVPASARRPLLVVAPARLNRRTMNTAFLLCLISALVTFGNTAPAPATAPEPLQTEDNIPSEDNLLPPYDIAEEPCRVGNVQYKHGEKVPRSDPCELCLCLHSGLFCWWQDQPGCPQRSTASSGAVSHSADDVMAFSPSSDAPLSTDMPPCIHQSCESDTQAVSSPPPFAANSPSPTAEGVTQSPLPSSHEPLSPGDPLQSTLPSAASAAAAAPVDTASSTPPASTVLPHTPVTCSVMGTEYQVGQVLPRATGTCLECVCGEGARLSCNPKDCAGGGPGATRGETGTGGGGTGNNDLDLGPSLDMFDVDTF